MAKIKDSIHKRQLYHFSFDTIDCENDFTDYAEAKEYLLCVLVNTKVLDILAINERSFILEFDNEQPKLFAYLKTNLEKYFYFTVSQIPISDKNSPTIHINRDIMLAIHQKMLLKSLKCSTSILRKISIY
ncbi:MULTISPECIES: hypothetical protein [unclassified Flavobacterium]|jgi:hypothetical protein|uniref:hypothetical protein n=1 Tax=unclassified Flavobacterium TaxID=196869 RepID=UPI00057F63C0|nr:MULTISPECIES: hypothetical protein [unclassified Flavobacterium]KIA94366.1 hypothetical protein OA93_19685 [Flavobacterium sp. KMS]KIC00855.1 hypothetical protein OA88_17570 [Flavobacterium sp. JRM]MEA9415297.1 hypothetical protein [Flavobacterium sp. PL02]OUL60640.1 hypothetical protein B8T70_19335 [Flavobacterium sp. AJR]